MQRLLDGCGEETTCDLKGLNRHDRKRDNLLDYHSLYGIQGRIASHITSGTLIQSFGPLYRSLLTLSRYFCRSLDLTFVESSFIPLTLHMYMASFVEMCYKPFVALC